jgi:tripartite-type tricarboxylate transporter receptor subunit TctC
MRASRRSLVLAAVMAVAGMSSALAQAQGFPSKTVRIVVPYPAGGGVDVMARALAAELTTAWGQPVIVENVAGANSMIGAEKVAGAAPDGHTLLMTISGTVVGNRFLYKKLPYDPDKSFAPISMVARSGQFILAHGRQQANTLQELVAAARRAPGSIGYSTPGNGSQEQLLLETIARRQGVDFLAVHYKGVAPALAAAVSGEVQVTAASPGLAAALVKDGRIKPLAIASEKRSPLFPQVPTTAEAGMPYARSTVWYGLFGVANTPAATLQKIHSDVTRIATRPDFAEKNMTARGLELVANTPAEFANELKNEVAATGEMVKATGLQPE